MLNEMVNLHPELVMEKGFGIPPNFVTMTTELSVEDPAYLTLGDLESFRKDVHRLIRFDHFECALQMSAIKLDQSENRVIMKWIFPEELAERFVYADYQELLQAHHIEKLTIDGKSSHSVRSSLFGYSTLK